MYWRRLLIGALLGGWVALPAHAARPQARILYAGDWNGPTQIFVADSSGQRALGQVTFDRPQACSFPAACGYTAPLPSPDGRWIAYRSVAADWDTGMLWLARADGTDARAVGVVGDAAWAPDSRRLAYSVSDGIHLLAPGGADRVVDTRAAAGLKFSPDGQALAFERGSTLVVRRHGHERALANDAAGSLAWSPDGSRLAYATNDGIAFLVLASRREDRLHVAPGPTPTYPSHPIDLDWSPDGRTLGFALDGVRVVDLRTRRVRTLTRGLAHDVAWSPDGRSLLYVEGGEDVGGDSITTGDIRTVTPAGRVRTVVSHTQAHGGQLLAAAWASPAPGVRYRAPQAVDGVFAGGPVQELAADGSRVAFVACAGVSAWTPSTGTVDSLQTAFACLAPYARGHLYSLALAGDRVAWWEKSWGLCFNWRAREATLGATSIDIDAGTGCLGSPPLDGSGTAVGAGDLLVRSSWKLHWSGEPRVVVDEQTVERIDPGGCPCPALSSSPGPYTPLDVDSGRIVVSGENETRILDADGKVLLTLPVPTLAAQLSGADLVVAPGDELRVYDASTGALRSTWPLPAAAGHDCDAFGDPTCLQPPALTLEDVSYGLAAYVVDGKVHVLRLSDGVDVVVAAGVRARFLDAGLAYADGARIRLLPWGQLPLR